MRLIVLEKYSRKVQHLTAEKFKTRPLDKYKRIQVEQ